MVVRVPDVRPSAGDLTLKAIARVRARGLGEVVGLVKERVRDAMSSAERLEILVRDCTEESLDLGSLVVRRATPDDAVAYARWIGTDAPRTFARRLSDSTWCYLVVTDNKILHATWCTIAAAWTRELHAYLAPPEGDAYVYESFTRADARGRGLYPLALRWIATDLYRSSCRRVWVGVEAGNSASLRAVEKAGFRPSFSIRFGRRKGKVWVIPEAPGTSSESLHITTEPPR
jgi:hypothetical protein